MISSAIPAELAEAIDKLTAPAQGSATEWLLNCTPILERQRQRQGEADAALEQYESLLAQAATFRDIKVANLTAEGREFAREQEIQLRSAAKAAMRRYEEIAEGE
jgi:hypothetical protein